MDDPTLTAAFEALQRAEFAALVWDQRWRVVAVTDELLTILGGGVERPDPPLGAHVFSAEWVEFQASRPGGPTFENQRKVFAAMVGALLGTTSGGEAELRGLVDPRLHDLLEGVEPTAGPMIWSPA